MSNSKKNKSADIHSIEQDIFDKYEPVIGLEVHCQLSTQSKLFCSCSTKFGQVPNANTCEVCLGYPGVLPSLNSKAVDYAIKMALAVNATINPISVFARKQYFYPDLPKGYQITQYDLPYCQNGYVVLSNGKKVNITRIHIEEDAGKNIHGEHASYIDLNRAGIPLLEIVSAPDIYSVPDAIEYLKQLRAIVRYLEISDGNLEEGSFRCDANVSVRLKGETKLNTRCEIKNLNSFKNIERALYYEIMRQVDLIEQGISITQQTLFFDTVFGKTYPVREKEQEHDYRYFPEPDLGPLYISRERIELLKNTLPKLPADVIDDLVNNYGIKKEDAYILAQENAIVQYFYEIIKNCKNIKNYSLIVHWILSEVLSEVNEGRWNVNEPLISAKNFAQLFELIENNDISLRTAKQVFKLMLDKEKLLTPLDIVKKYDLFQINDVALIQSTIKEVLDNNVKQVQEFAAGKDKIFVFFVGQVLNKSKGKYNPELVNLLLKEELSKRLQDENK